MMNKFYMADSFDRAGDVAYCNAVCDASKGLDSIGTMAMNTMSSWEPMATVASVDKFNEKFAEMAKSIEELKKSFEAVNSKPLRTLRSQLRTLDARRYSNDFTRVM